MTQKGKLFVVSAPSGTGKTTLVKEVINRLSEKHNISKVITYTTREPREGEVNGVDYHFISHADFIEKMNSGFFLESTNYVSKPYASPISIKKELELNKSLILVVDREGAKSALKEIDSPITIWIKPPSIEELKTRIIGRGTETDAQMDSRLKLAKQELELEDKKRIFKYHVVNKAFEKALSELLSIIEDELSKQA